MGSACTTEKQAASPDARSKGRRDRFTGLDSKRSPKPEEFTSVSSGAANGRRRSMTSRSPRPPPYGKGAGLDDSARAASMSMSDSSGNSLATHVKSKKHRLGQSTSSDSAVSAGVVRRRVVDAPTRTPPRPTTSDACVDTCSLDLSVPTDSVAVGPDTPYVAVSPPPLAREVRVDAKRNSGHRVTTVSSPLSMVRPSAQPILPATSFSDSPSSSSRHVVSGITMSSTSVSVACTPDLTVSNDKFDMSMSIGAWTTASDTDARDCMRRCIDMQSAHSQRFPREFIKGLGQTREYIDNEDVVYAYAYLLCVRADTPDNMRAFLRCNAAECLTDRHRFASLVVEVLGEEQGKAFWNDALAESLRLRQSAHARSQSCRETSRSSPMDEVVPGLWIGSYHAAMDLDLLKAHGIQHVASAVDMTPFAVGPGWRTQQEFDEYPIHYWSAELRDVEGFPIADSFDDSYRFIHEAYSRGRPVLIHCGAGASRSVALAVHYLCGALSLTVSDAMRVIRTGRAHMRMKTTFLYDLLLRHQGNKDAFLATTVRSRSSSASIL